MVHQLRELGEVTTCRLPEYLDHALAHLVELEQHEVVAPVNGREPLLLPHVDPRQISVETRERLEPIEQRFELVKATLRLLLVERLICSEKRVFVGMVSLEERPRLIVEVVDLVQLLRRQCVARCLQACLQVRQPRIILGDQRPVRQLDLELHHCEQLRAAREERMNGRHRRRRGRSELRGGRGGVGLDFGHGEEISKRGFTLKALGR